MHVRFEGRRERVRRGWGKREHEISILPLAF